MSLTGAAFESLVTPLAAALRGRNLQLGVAESCTGGLLAAALTDLPGASDFFVGGVVTYSNALKVGLLDVPGGLIAEHGAVSREVAAAMALGAVRRLGCDLALSVTGIAGPATEEPAPPLETGGKPVGLTFIGAAVGERVTVWERRWPGGRAANRVASVEAALLLALEVLS